MQHRGDLVALGHDVVEQHAILLGERKRLAQGFEARRVDRHRLVCQHVHAGSNGAGQILGLVPVVAGNDGDIARPVRREAVQEIRTRIDLRSPGRRIG